MAVNTQDNTYILSGEEIYYEERAVGYLTAALRAGVWAVRQHINRDDYKHILGNEIAVDMDAPMEEQRYPYIHVMYRDKGFRPLALRGYGKYERSDGTELELSAYRYSGEYLINIYATSILERETIADCCIGAFGIDRRFKQLLIDNPYINIAPNLHTLSSPTSNESWGTPWDKDVMTAFRQLSFDVTGEFYYRVEKEPVYLERLVIQGYMEELALPTIVIEDEQSE